jgi:hypothetical protein
MSSGFGIEAHQSPESDLALGFLKRALMLIPFGGAAGLLFAGLHGMLSGLFGMVLVLINFVIIFLFFREGSRFGPVGSMAAAFVALLVGLMVLTAATIPFARAPWMDLPIFGVILILGHIVVVTVEARRVSGRLGDSGLKPWRLVK